MYCTPVKIDRDAAARLSQYLIPMPKPDGVIDEVQALRDNLVPAHLGHGLNDRGRRLGELSHYRELGTVELAGLLLNTRPARKSLLSYLALSASAAIPRYFQYGPNYADISGATA